jgi:hypothetical protein
VNSLEVRPDYLTSLFKNVVRFSEYRSLELIDMNKILVIVGVFFLASCGPSQEEKQNVALNACSIMSATNASFGGLQRMQTMVDAREKLGEEAFTGGDDGIAEAFEWELCEELVLNDKNYNKTLQSLKDAYAERQRIADTKPTVKRKYWANGSVRWISNHQPVADGGKLHGLEQQFADSGQSKEEYKSNPKRGKLINQGNYKDGKLDGIYTEWFKYWDAKSREAIYVKGCKHGIEKEWSFRGFDENNPDLIQCYVKGRKAPIESCEAEELLNNLPNEC